MSKYILTKNAENNICEISVYTINNHGYIAWKKYRSMLHKNFEIIADMPSIGNQEYMSKKQISNDIYKITAGKHHILYKLNTITSTVYIIGLIHTSRNLKRVSVALS